MELEKTFKLDNDTWRPPLEMCMKMSINFKKGKSLSVASLYLHLIIMCILVIISIRLLKKEANAFQKSYDIIINVILFQAQHR